MSEIEELDKTVVPFGKHKGKRFGETPLSYLEWLRDRPDLREPLKTKLNDYLEHPTIQRELGKEER